MDGVDEEGTLHFFSDFTDAFFTGTNRVGYSVQGAEYDRIQTHISELEKLDTRGSRCGNVLLDRGLRRARSSRKLLDCRRYEP